jgi:multidrug efflux pump subunit AcrA (membrane-fusion protein)
MAVTRKKRKWWRTPLILVIIVVLGVAAFFGYRYVSAQNSGSLPANLTTVKVTLGTLAATVGASGNVYSNQTASLTWQTAGKIGTLNVKQGDTVKAGQVLATLDPTSLTNNNVILPNRIYSAPSKPFKTSKIQRLLRPLLNRIWRQLKKQPRMPRMRVIY